MLKYLSVKQVILIHSDIIRNFGGSLGIHSKDLLESAVFRMQASFGGKDLYPTVFDKAAALFESLIKNHPFVDGNKRTAFVAAVTFLEINGYQTNFDPQKAEDFVLAVVKGGKSFRDVVRFLKRG